MSSWPPASVRLGAECLLVGCHNQWRDEATVRNMHEDDVAAQSRQCTRQPLFGGRPPPPRVTADDYKARRLEQLHDLDWVFAHAREHDRPRCVRVCKPLESSSFRMTRVIVRRPGI